MWGSTDPKFYITHAFPPLLHIPSWIRYQSFRVGVGEADNGRRRQSGVGMVCLPPQDRAPCPSQWLHQRLHSTVYTFLPLAPPLLTTVHELNLHL